MADTAKPDCQHPGGHHLHLCQLKKRGLADEVDARTNAPAYICHNCNAVANRAEDLCNCSPYAARPRTGIDSA